MAPRRVVIGLLGTTLDAGRGPERWDRWRPTVSLCQHEELSIDRLELLYPRAATLLAKQVAKDIEQVSPGTAVGLHLADPRDPWDFEEVYTCLLDFSRRYPFDPEREEYLVHITTGTHVAQICMFLLTETRRFPAKLIQTSPMPRTKDPAGEFRVIDLDLSKYDTIAARFDQEFTSNIEGLKSGIGTRNEGFNRLIDELERVAAGSTDPLLLTGPTGAGKSQLARRIYELKRHRRQVEGAFVEVNCATLRGDSAMSALFGHKRGAFTGAGSDRQGLLRTANKGVLFLDEVGELGLDEQAMLLRALEQKRFLPLGSDVEAASDFQLIAGTNRDLPERVSRGLFREDLLARINLWSFRLPPLRDRREDIEPNLEYEIEQFARRSGRTVRFTVEAKSAYLRFAGTPAALWTSNFRDLSASVTRMATLAASGRITDADVVSEIQRLTAFWKGGAGADERRHEGDDNLCASLLGHEATNNLDRFDLAQLEAVLRTCRSCNSLSQAGRELFAASRGRRSTVNDADRLRKYLARFGLSWGMISGQNA